LPLGQPRVFLFLRPEGFAGVVPDSRRLSRGRGTVVALDPLSVAVCPLLIGRGAVSASGGDLGGRKRWPSIGGIS
jgi:hypothetical protein